MREPDESEFVERRPRQTSVGVVYDWYYQPVREGRAVELIETMDTGEQARLCESIGSNITVMVRVAVYSPEQYSDSQARERARLMNEMMHGLWRQLSSLLGHTNSEPYTPEQFCRAMYEKSRDGRFEGEFAAYVMSSAIWGVLSRRTEASTT